MRDYSSAPDYYSVLQVSPTASPEVVRAAYHALARRYHPDAGGPQADEEFTKELNAAKEVLCDPVARSRYDAERSVGRVAEPAAWIPPVWEPPVSTAASPVSVPVEPLARQPWSVAVRWSEAGWPRRVGYVAAVWQAGWFALLLVYLGLKAVFHV